MRGMWLLVLVTLVASSCAPADQGESSYVDCLNVPTYKVDQIEAGLTV